MHKWILFFPFKFRLFLLIIISVLAKMVLFPYFLLLVKVFSLTQIYYIPWHVQVDVYGFRRPTYAMEWMGMHALMIYILIACNILPVLIQGFYWKEPQNNLVSSLNFINCTVLLPSLITMNRNFDLTSAFSPFSSALNSWRFLEFDHVYKHWLENQAFCIALVQWRLHDSFSPKQSFAYDTSQGMNRGGTSALPIVGEW